MLPHVERLVDEYAELRTKYFKLRDFIEGEKIKELNLSLINQHLLIKQYQVMAEYIEILRLRLSVEGLNTDNNLLFNLERRDNGQ